MIFSFLVNKLRCIFSGLNLKNSKGIGGVLNSGKQAGSDTTILGTLKFETETQEQCKD